MGTKEKKKKNPKKIKKRIITMIFKTLKLMTMQ